MPASYIVKPTHHSALAIVNDRDISTGIGGADAVGGRIIKCTAAAALYIGDAVYFDNAGKVNKSGTAATVGAAFAGIVVGGESLDLDWRVSYTALVLASPVTAASGDGKIVFVQIDGVANVRTDGAVAAGARVVGGTTAGRVDAGTTQGAMLGTVCGIGAAGGAAVTQMLIDHR